MATPATPTKSPPRSTQKTPKTPFKTPSKSNNPLLRHFPYSSTSRARLQALYSDISRQKQSNPTSYQANIEWWRNALEMVVREGLQLNSQSRLVLKADASLYERTKVEGAGKPLALGTVVNELRAARSLLLKSEFLAAKESIYTPAWLPGRIASYVVGKPLWWTMERLGVVGEDGYLTNMLASGSKGPKDSSWWGGYVVVPLLEKAADRVVEEQKQKVNDPSGRLYSVEGFRREFSDVLGFGEEGALMTEEDARVLLKFLERDRKVLLTDDEVIKFQEGTRQVEITAADHGILELNIAVTKLRQQIDALQLKVDECSRKATEAVARKQKEVALSYLRSRKQMHELLTKRLSSLATLESTLISVETAAGDIELMKAYESSTATLRAILSHPSLQKGSIDETMEALAEANADAREIDEAVRLGGDIAVGGSDLTFDEKELEEELAQLAEEAEKESRSAEVERKLGQIGVPVPDGAPVVHEGKEDRTLAVAES